MSLPAPPSQSAPTQSANQQASTYAHPHTQKLHDLQIFLNAAPALLHEELQQLSDEERSQARMKRFLLPSGDYVSCIWWDGIFHITGTDVVRSLVFRFEVSGRPVRNIKKFEEGVFSDLRNLKPGVASVMEEAKVSSSTPLAEIDVIVSGIQPPFLRDRPSVSFPGPLVSTSVHTHPEKTKSVLLVR
jgi:transcription factor STE12